MQLIEVRGGVHVQQVPVPVPVPAVVERVVSMCCAVGRAELWKNVVPSMTTCTCTCTCCNVSKCAQLMTSRSPACTGHGAIQLYAEYGIGLTSLEGCRQASGYRAATVYIMFIIICGEMCACGSLIRSVITHDTVEYTHQKSVGDESRE